jgi:hypothetical protein
VHVTDEQRREPGPPPRGLCAVGWDAGCIGDQDGNFILTRVLRVISLDGPRSNPARTHACLPCERCSA